jgi:hypothetical protein
MIACVEETGSRSRVAARIHRVAPARAAKTKEDSGVVCRRLWGVKTVKSLPEIRIAETLPMPVKKPPQMSGLRFLGGEPDGPGIIKDATLFPASLAPFAKASANRAASPNSSIVNIKGLELQTICFTIHYCRTHLRRVNDVSLRFQFRTTTVGEFESSSNSAHYSPALNKVSQRERRC